MNDPDPRPVSSDVHAWECGWEEHDMLQLQRLAKLSLPEKIAWLEQAQRVVEQLKREREKITERNGRAG